MADLQQFLDADAGGSQDFDDRPRPRTRGLPRWPGRVVSRWPGRRPRPCRPRPCRGDRPGQGLPGGGEASRRAGSGGPPPAAPAACLRRSSTVRTRTGRTGSRSRVRASMRDLRCRACFALVDLLLADRAGRDPRRPAGGVLERPLGQVQVEGPDRGQALAVAEPVGPVTAVFSPVAAGDRLRLGAQPLLPGVGDLGGQVQAVDAGMVAFEVLPEQRRPGSRRGFAGCV